MPEEHFIGKVAQKAIIADGGKVLITINEKDHGKWGLPGGRLNTKEDPRHGVAREVKEELGVDVKIGEIIFIEQFTHNNDNIAAILIAYTATLTDSKVDFHLDSNEVTEIKWITKLELDNQPMFTSCYNALKAYFAKYE